MTNKKMGGSGLKRESVAVKNKRMSKPAKARARMKDKQKFKSGDEPRWS